MRFHLAALMFAGVFACAAPAGAATIYTFSLSDGSAVDPGSIQSFSFDPLGAGGTLTMVKEIDSFSLIALDALVSGTSFPGATFTAYDGVVSPAARLFEYALTNALFTSIQYGGTLEMIAIQGETVTLTRGPAAVPEPATLLLLGTAAALAVRRRARR